MFKKIKALIDSFHLDEVQVALEELGIKGVIISSCNDFAPQKGPAMIFRGKERATDYLSAIRLEMVVDQEMAREVIEAIQEADGAHRDRETWISVLPVEEVISLETLGGAEYPGLGGGT